MSLGTQQQHDPNLEPKPEVHWAQRKHGRSRELGTGPSFLNHRRTLERACQRFWPGPILHPNQDHPCSTQSVSRPITCPHAHQGAPPTSPTGLSSQGPGSVFRPLIQDPARSPFDTTHHSVKERRPEVLAPVGLADMACEATGGFSAHAKRHRPRLERGLPALHAPHGLHT